MKTSRHFTLILFTLFLICRGVAPAMAANDASLQQVQQTFNVYVDAWKRCDLERLSEVYATDKDLVVYWPDPYRPFLLKGWTEIRTELQKIFKEMGSIDLEFTVQNVNFYGDVAILTANWKWLTPFGVIDQDNATGRCTLVFQRRGSRWVIIHEHSSWRPPSLDAKETK